MKQSRENGQKTPILETKSEIIWRLVAVLVIVDVVVVWVWWR